LAGEPLIRKPFLFRSESTEPGLARARKTLGERKEFARKRRRRGLWLPVNNLLFGHPRQSPAAAKVRQSFQWWLKAGWQKKCDRGSVMLKVSALLLFIVLLGTSCSTPPTSPVVRFNEQEQANLIVRYYTDDTSYVLKPTKTDGPFLSVLGKDAVLDVAKQQPGRELAVVILIHYGAESEAGKVKHKWTTLLTEMGYQRVVFLRSSGNMRVNGLPVLAQGG
jgi:hypothetical protein